MNLYDRSIDSARVRSDAGIFVRQTYALFALSLLAASIGALFGMKFLAQYFVGGFVGPLVALVVEIALIVYLQRADHVNNLALVALFAFGFVSGITLCGIITYTLAVSGAGVLAEALFLTTAAFAGLSFFAFVTKKDFSVFSKALFVALIILVVASLIQLFVQSSLLSFVLAVASAILFSFFIIYDTQNLIRGAYRTPIQGAICLYLDFINLFVALLQILNAINRR